MRAHIDWKSDQLRTFLSTIGDDPLHMLFTVIGVTGLRLREALDLRWSDVDLDAETLHVWKLDRTTESKADGRTVDLDRGTAQLLKWHGCRQRLQRWKTGSLTETDMVFTRPDGSALNPVAVSQRFDRLVIDVGLPHIRLDDLHHCAPLASEGKGSDVRAAE